MSKVLPKLHTIQLVVCTVAVSGLTLDKNQTSAWKAPILAVTLFNTVPIKWLQNYHIFIITNHY